jgi:hypothetical protein
MGEVFIRICLLDGIYKLAPELRELTVSGKITEHEKGIWLPVIFGG